MTIKEYFDKHSGTIKRLADVLKVPVYVEYADTIERLMAYNYGNCDLFYEESEIDVVLTSLMLASEYTFTKLYDTLSLEYNPIENYRMTEVETEDTSGASSLTNGTHTTTISVSPFNNPDQITPTQQSTTPEIKSSTSDSGNRKRNLTRSGNIGVTTSQQMVEAERALSNINIPSDIAKYLVRNIAILVYAQKQEASDG